MLLSPRSSLLFAPAFSSLQPSPSPCSIVGGVNEDMELVLKTSSTIVMDVKVSGKYGTILTIAAGVDGRIVWR